MAEASQLLLTFSWFYVFIKNSSNFLFLLIITISTLQFDFVYISSLSVQTILEATNCFKDACAYKYFCFFLTLFYNLFSLFLYTSFIIIFNLVALKKAFSIILFIRFNKRLKNKNISSSFSFHEHYSGCVRTTNRTPACWRLTVKITLIFNSLSTNLFTRVN